MKRNYHTLQIVMGLLCLTSVTLNFILLRNDKSVSDAIAAHQTDYPLSLSECKELASAIESQDKVRLDRWKMRLSDYLEKFSSTAPRNLDELAALYKANEAPGRSNYFHELIVNLAIINGLERSALTNYLGKPDKTQKISNGEYLWYDYELYGLHHSAWIVVSNDLTTAIMFDAAQQGSR